MPTCSVALGSTYSFAWRYDSWDTEHPYWIEKLSGSDYVRKAVDAGKDVDEVVAGWRGELERFKATRKKYLLYGAAGSAEVA